MTARGYGLLAAGTLLLGAGFLLHYPELVALGCAGVVAVVGALAFVAWRPRLEVERTADPDRVMRGEVSGVRLDITNASRYFGASLVARDRLRPNKVTQVNYAVPTARRGLIDVGPLEVSRRDPLGLVGVVRRYGSSAKVWVRPRVHLIAAVPVGLSRSMDGRVDRVPHGSLTFSALREYVVGDDLRHVHWRTSARVGELMVREHVDTSLPRVVVLLDDRAEAHATGPDGESTFEAACEAAASVMVAASREDIHVEIRLVAATATAAGIGIGGGGDAAIAPMLDLLAEANLVSTNGSAGGSVAVLRDAVERLRVRRIGDTLLFLTGPPDEEDLGVVAGLRGAYPSIIAGVFGPVETGLATNSGILVVGAADGADFAGAWDGIRAW